MLSLLDWIWDAIRSVPWLIVDLLVAAFNAIVVAIATLASAVLALLPSFPSPPDPPDDGVLAALAWVAPIGTIVAGFAVLVALWIAYLLIRIPLRWVKAL